jgi:molecular chaperone HtpG
MNKNIKIGKFTLESLTTGMYSDPRIIFREYIQNSTDAIDDAIKYGLINSREDGRIEISLDKRSRFLSIKDNGTGIAQFKVWNTLCDVGSSSKDFSKQRGFRGIGRLGGLSYAKTLRFVTSVKGENKKSIITWDCEKLKKMLRPGDFENYDLSMVIQEVTAIDVSSEKSDSHYFSVELIEIDKQFDILLDTEDIKSYLSQVAPVPFHAQYFLFYHDSEIGIKKQLEKIDKPLEEYFIYLNDDPNPIYKPYKNYVKAGKGENEKRDNIQEIKYIKEYDENDNLIFWGWYGITNFYGYIKDEAIAGIRVRKNNIQIGNIKTLDDFFSESRFNKWFVGEVYIYDKDILPNARRDDFEKNDSYINFKEKLEKYTKQVLSKLPRMYSTYNSATNKVEKKAKELETIEEQVIEGVSSEIERQQLHKQRDEILKELTKSKKDLEKVKSKISTKVSSKIDSVIEKTKKLEKQTQNLENDIIDADYKLMKSKALSGYSKDAKKVLIKVFEVIDKELPSEQAKQLELNIIESLKKGNNKKRK